MLDFIMVHLFRVAVFIEVGFKFNTGLEFQQAQDSEPSLCLMSHSEPSVPASDVPF